MTERHIGMPRLILLGIATGRHSLGLSLFDSVFVFRKISDAGQKLRRLGWVAMEARMAMAQSVLLK